jgi:lipopolysaccharide export system protein LptA
VTVFWATLVSTSLALSGSSAALAEEPAATEDGRAALEGTADRFGLSVARNAPLTIEAVELEAMRDDQGRERVVFRRQVRVEQGGLRLGCDWLEAIYPDGAGGRPDRITARGAVRIAQADTAVDCTEVVFQNAACTATCTSDKGPAVLRRGENVIEGDEILFDICTGMLKVRNGRVRVSGGSERARDAEIGQP